MGLYSHLPRVYFLLSNPSYFNDFNNYRIFFLFAGESDRKTCLVFVMTLTCVTLAIFLPADLILGGRRLIYKLADPIPCYLGMQIAVAYFLAIKMTSPQVTLLWQKLWRLALAALLSIGILSCCIYLPADSWWNKDQSHLNIPIARTVNSASRASIIADLWCTV